jgi:hypothetical protein
LRTSEKFSKIREKSEKERKKERKKEKKCLGSKKKNVVTLVGKEQQKTRQEHYDSEKHIVKQERSIGHITILSSIQSSVINDES